MKNKKFPKFYYVYIVTNLILNKQYVGSRICYKDKIEDDNYWGSSKYLNEDYIIYGMNNFTKEIITAEYTNAKNMLEGESYYIHKYNTLSPNGYNLTGGGEGIFNASKEIRAKIAYANKNRSSESRESMRKKLLGKKLKPEIVAKMIEKRRGRKHSEATKKKMSQSLIGNTRMVGKKHSPETIKKMKAAWVLRRAKSIPERNNHDIVH